MRIGLAISRLGTGGSEQQLILLAGELAKRGHEVEVLCYGGASKHDSMLIGSGVSLRVGQARSWFSKVRLFRRWLGDFRPCIVHAFMKRASTLAVMARGSNPSVRVIGSDLSTATYNRRSPALWFALIAFTFATRIATQTEINRRSLVGLNPMLRRKVVVIRNGCDVSAFPGAGAPDVNDCFRFAVVGTVYKVKNPIVVVEAVSILKSRINVGFRVDWYGRFGLNGDSEPSADCVAAIRLMETLGVGESITFHGETRPIAPKLREVSAFLHASRQEGFPNAVIEAMLSGLPLVVSRVSDLPLVVQEARNGFCFDETDAGALADAMQHMIETPLSQRLAMGARSRELAVRWFGLERFVDEYENLYSGLLEPRN